MIEIPVGPPPSPCPNCELVHSRGERFIIVGFKPGKAWKIEGEAPKLHLGGEDGSRIEIPEGVEPELVETMVPDVRKTCAWGTV